MIEFNGDLRLYNASSYLSFTELGLIPMQVLEVAPPKPKVVSASPNNIDGTIDSTAQDMGIVHYANRTGSWSFKRNPYAPATFTQIKTAIMRYCGFWLDDIRLTNDIDEEGNLFSYNGRITVNEWKTSKTGEVITINYEIYPYKTSPLYSGDEIYEVHISSSGWSPSVDYIQFPTSDKPVSPKMHYWIYGSGKGNLSMHYKTYVVDRMNGRWTTRTRSEYVAIESDSNVKEGDIILPDFVVMNATKERPAKVDRLEIAMLTSDFTRMAVDWNCIGGVI